MVATTNRKILIVDDESIVRRNFKRVLDDQGYEVNTAADGIEALELLGKDDYNLIITDMKMPRMSGIEVLKKVRDGFPHIAVVVVTGYGTVDSALEAMKMGACDFIEKPLTSDQISDAVTKAFERTDSDMLHGAEVERRVIPEEIYPIDYSEETAEEWSNVLKGFRNAVAAGRIEYDPMDGWTCEEMQQRLTHLLTEEIQKKMHETGLTVKDIARYRPTLLPLCEMIRKGYLSVMLERWTQPFWNPKVGLGVDKEYFEGLLLVPEAKSGAAERKLKAFEREVYRGNLCSMRDWNLKDIMDSFNDYDRLFRGGCFGRRKCHMEDISVCKLGFDEINKCC
jgi:FixJ family two-component response regulator